VNVIAIDGPAAAGKGTIAAFLARRLGYIHIDSGLFYRYFAEQMRGCDDLEFFDPLIHFIQTGKDPGGIIPKLRTESCGQKASKVSQDPQVRQYVNAAVRSIKGNAVIDGRDTATVIFPNATVKLFVTADVETRAQRRMLDEHGLLEDLQKYTNAIINRDKNDTLRTIAPLVSAKDAILLDTSGLTIKEMCEKSLEIVRTLLNKSLHVQ
jgi:cytidylate kinase